jgi:hypothetical protein
MSAREREARKFAPDGPNQRWQQKTWPSNKTRGEHDCNGPEIVRLRLAENGRPQNWSKPNQTYPAQSRQNWATPYMAVGHEKKYTYIYIHIVYSFIYLWGATAPRPPAPQTPCRGAAASRPPRKSISNTSQRPNPMPFRTILGGFRLVSTKMILVQCTQQTDFQAGNLASVPVFGRILSGRTSKSAHRPVFDRPKVRF